MHFHKFFHWVFLAVEDSLDCMSLKIRTLHVRMVRTHFFLMTCRSFTTRRYLRTSQCEFCFCRVYVLAKETMQCGLCWLKTIKIKEENTTAAFVLVFGHKPVEMVLKEANAKAARTLQEQTVSYCRVCKRCTWLADPAIFSLQDQLITHSVQQKKMHSIKSALLNCNLQKPWK